MALTVPLVEFYIFPKLVDLKKPAETARQITSNASLFSTAIFIHLLTVLCDLILAWALYIFLRPVNKELSLLAAWFRLLYAAFNVVAISSLVQVTSILNTQEYFATTEPAQVNDAILLHIKTFNLEWRLGLIFFGAYLLLLGYLVMKASYIPKLVGAFLFIAGLGYIIDDLRFFFYPKFDTGFLWLTFFGELIFMLWLFIKGTRINKWT